MTDPQRAQDGPKQDRRSQASPMGAAREPVGTGPAPLVAQLFALALIALGVVGVQEALLRSEAVGGTSWTSAALTQVDQRGPGWWLLPCAALTALVGVALILAALRRRPRRTLSLASQTGVYLRTTDLAPVLARRLEGMEGASDFQVSTTRGRATLRVTTLRGSEDNDALASEARRRVGATLEALERAPRVKVKIKNEVIR